MSAPHSIGLTKRGRGRRVVDDQRQVVLVRDPGQRLDVGHVKLGIAESLGVYGFGFLADRLSQAVEIVGIDEADIDAQLGQRVVEKVVGAAVERGGGNDLVAGAGQRGDRKRLRRLAGSGSQSALRRLPERRCAARRRRSSDS